MSKNLKTGLMLGAAALAFALIFQGQLWALPITFLISGFAISYLIDWSNEGSEDGSEDLSE